MDKNVTIKSLPEGTQQQREYKDGITKRAEAMKLTTDNTIAELMEKEAHHEEAHPKAHHAKHHKK